MAGLCRDAILLCCEQYIVVVPQHSIVAGVLDEPYSQLTPLSGVAVQARQSTQAGTVFILCRLGSGGPMATPLSWLS